MVSHVRRPLTRIVYGTYCVAIISGNWLSLSSDFVDAGFSTFASVLEDEFMILFIPVMKGHNIRP